VTEWPDYAARYDTELRRECCESHILYGAEATCIAKADNSDDFIFSLADGKWALVHLTYQVETSPNWPAAKMFDSLEECLDLIKSQQ
jgi:hypothetical protein